MRNTNGFEHALTMWESKPNDDKTWKNVKTHFYESQLNLKNIRGPTMQQAGCHHANALVAKVTRDINEQLQVRDNYMLAMLQCIPSLPSLAESSASEDTEDNASPAVNRITTDDTQLVILRLLRDIKNDTKK